MKIVAGLGNPGSKYQKTRHNVGFDVLDELARRHAADAPRLRFEAMLREIHVSGEKLLLAAPQTFMNLSGRSVRQIADFYKIESADIVIVCDDMNLDTGRLRWRGQGSAGGQKGLHDIINRLGTQQIPRLRIGIGRPPGQMEATDWVLGRFRGDEVAEMDIAVQRAADSIEEWIRSGLAAVMNRFNIDARDA